MLWLKNLKDSPPGEFYFRQSEAGSTLFGPSPLIGTVVGLVIDFRKGNQLPGADYQSVMRDVIQYTVDRLIARYGERCEWLIDTEEKWIPPVSTGGCAGCGAVLP